MQKAGRGHQLPHVGVPTVGGGVEPERMTLVEEPVEQPVTQSNFLRTFPVQTMLGLCRSNP
jgi:hypothetical protein